MPTPSQVPRAGLGERLLLRFSEGRVIDGLWIGTPESQSEDILHRVEQALLLIKTHDHRRYDRLRRDLVRVWVHLLSGEIGCFNAALRACEIDPRFVLRSSITPSDVAAVITHEATHARLEQCGIRYSKDRRHRIEGVCYRQEIVFAKRLPDGTAVRQRAERMLGKGPEFWSDASCEEQLVVEEHIEALRYLGAPEWLLSVFRTGQALIRKVRSLLK